MGARLALVFSAERRAEIQKDFSDGRSKIETVSILFDILYNAPKDVRHELVKTSLASAFDKVLGWFDVSEQVSQIADYINDAFASASRRLFDPLVLDIDRDGIELVSIEQSTAQFDLDADGFREQTGWVKADDGMLALDANSDGKINNITELFGDATTDGFDELKTLDSNNDNVINASDAKFTQLLIWQDLNQDGITDPGELKTLSQLGIQSISLNTTKTNVTNQGNQVRTTSNFTRTNGTQSEIASIWYAVDRLNTTYDQPYQLNPDTLYDASNDNTDQLLFSGTGLTAANAIVTRIGTTNNLQITFQGIAGSILLVDQIENYYYPNRGVESITFSDGTVWNENQLWNAYMN